MGYYSDLFIHFIGEIGGEEVQKQESFSTSRRKVGSIDVCVSCLAPSLDPEFIDKVTNDMDEIEDVDGWSEHAYHEYS